MLIQELFGEMLDRRATAKARRKTCLLGVSLVDNFWELYRFDARFSTKKLV